MADISKEIDKIAELIEQKTGQAIEEIARSLMELTQDKTPEEALEMLSGINLQYAMDTKLAVAFASIDAGALLILKNMSFAAPLAEESLRTLLDMAKKKLRTELTEKLSENMLQSIIDGIATKSPIEDVIKAVGDATPSISTLVNTTYNQFSNTITNMMLDKLPDDSVVIYIGANDTLTRDECKHKIAFSPATKKEVLEEYGNFNNELWNCRHKWEEMSKDKESQGFEEKPSE